MSGHRGADGTSGGPGAAGVRVLTADQVPALAPADVLLAVREAFTELAAGRAVQPPQLVLDLPDGGDVITYPALLPDAGVHCVKVSPYLPRPAGPAVVTAWTLLLSTRTGLPLVLVDSAALTVRRTAATSALAVDLLAPERVGTLAVVGSGPVGWAHAEQVAAVRAFDRVRVHSRSGRAAPPDVPPGVQVLPDLEEVLQGADVVCLCTSAAEAVVDLAALPAGTVVTSVSTNAPMAREVSPSALAAADVYCDLASAAPRVAGEMVLAAAEGSWTAEDLRGDLPGLLAGTAPGPRGDRPVLFRSVGLGIEDAAVARLLVG